MTIQQLRYFLALCEDLNYTPTAGRLYLSRQALRLSIAALEEELCGPLFINVRNHLALTEKGQRFRAQPLALTGGTGAHAHKFFQLAANVLAARLLMALLQAGNDAVKVRFIEA